jgi:ethanolamine ammonia-lyase large subunit
MYSTTAGHQTFTFPNLRMLMAKASPYRSGDALAGLSADSYQERVAAQICLADLPVKKFLSEALIPYEEDEVTRLIIDTHDAKAFATISSFTVGQLRDWLLSNEVRSDDVARIRNAITPEMALRLKRFCEITAEAPFMCWRNNSNT